jgi:hypothetical protein
MEAPSGIEPLNKGFADLSLSHLGTAPRSRSILAQGAGRGQRTLLQVRVLGFVLVSWLFVTFQSKPAEYIGRNPIVGYKVPV